MSEKKVIDQRNLPSAVYAASVYAEQVKMLTKEVIALRLRAETAEAKLECPECHAIDGHLSGCSSIATGKLPCPGCANFDGKFCLIPGPKCKFSVKLEPKP